MSVPARVLHALIGVYQRVFSWRASPCRFFPSCSVYARQAIVYHGAVRGSWLAVRRLARCQPWGGFGGDPVPAPRAGSDHAVPGTEPGMRTHV